MGEATYILAEVPRDDLFNIELAILVFIDRFKQLRLHTRGRLSVCLSMCLSVTALYLCSLRALSLYMHLSDLYTCLSPCISLSLSARGVGEMGEMGEMG